MAGGADLRRLPREPGLRRPPSCRPRTSSCARFRRSTIPTTCSTCATRSSSRRGPGLARDGLPGRLSLRADRGRGLAVGEGRRGPALPHRPRQGAGDPRGGADAVVGTGATAADLARVRATYELEPPFVLFPGVTWPHKNHLRLFEALAHLRDERGIDGAAWSARAPATRRSGRGSRLRCASSGSPTRCSSSATSPRRTCAASTGSPRVSCCPSLYEASSLPIFEAWLDGLPVACSNATGAAGAGPRRGLLFDPTDVDGDRRRRRPDRDRRDLRRDLRARGYERLKDFDLLRTAKAYRAVYRRAAGFALTDEDRWLLEWDWMRGAQQREQDPSCDRQERTSS